MESVRDEGVRICFKDGSVCEFRDAYAVTESMTVIDWTVRVVTQHHGEHVFTLTAGDRIDGDIREWWGGQSRP
jgi:tRNA U34 2-thiouridine synthase MnmA/TrmU